MTPVHTYTRYIRTWRKIPINYFNPKLKEDLDIMIKLGVIQREDEMGLKHSHRAET